MTRMLFVLAICAACVLGSVSHLSAQPPKGFTAYVALQRNEQDARKAFEALQAKYPNLLGKLDTQIRRIELSGKRVFFRAEVGSFDNRDAATKFCNDLHAAGSPCVIVDLGQVK
jgi:hypothetical protein